MCHLPLECVLMLLSVKVINFEITYCPNFLYHKDKLKAYKYMVLYMHIGRLEEI